MIRQLTGLNAAVAAFLLLLVVALGPLPFGSVLPPARLGLEVASLLALFVLLLPRPGAAALAGATVPAAALAGVGVFGWLQSLSWPAFVAAWAAPRGAAAWEASRDLLGVAPEGVPLSLAPAISRSTALAWLAAAAALAAACGVAADRRWRRLPAVGLLAVAVFEIAYGADRWFERSPEIWGRTLAAGGERLRGTFVNPDHFAMFLIIALAGCFAWVWWSMRRALWRESRFERRLLHVVLPWFFFVMLFVGLAFTGSRAGFLGGMAALLAQALLLGFRKRRWQASLPGLGAMALGLGSLLYFGWQRGMGRWIETSAFDITWNARLQVYHRSLELWRQFPWTGTGLGTFRQAFPLVQPPDLELSWFHAHSDVLELLVTTGLVGPALVLWGLGALGPRLWHNLRHGRRSEDRAVVLAACGALVGVLAHAAIDFGLTLPANAFLLAIVLGLACGVPRRSPPPKEESPREKSPDPRRKRGPERSDASDRSDRV